MANEVTTTSATEYVMTEIISDMVYEAAYAEMVFAPNVRNEDISSAATNTVEIPKEPLLTAADLTEGTDLANTAYNPTSVTVAADEAGLMITLTDLLVNADIFGSVEIYASGLGRALANKIDTDLLAEVADFTTSVGSTGADLTETNWLDGIYNLENGNAVADIFACVHPIQIRDLRVDIATSAGAVWGASAGPNGLVMRMGSFYGVPTFTSTNCASVASDADRQGYMGPRGIASGIVLAMKRPPAIEPERNASLRGTELVAVTTYGDEAANTAANGGVKIVTDHE